MWFLSSDGSEIWLISKGYIILVSCIVAVSLLTWADYECRVCRVEFKNFPVKWQARIPGLIGACFILIIIIFWLFQPGLFVIGCWLTGVHCAISAVYRMTMSIINTDIMKTGTLQEQLNAIHATRNSDPLEVQMQLEDFYKKKYSIKRITKYLALMADGDNETKGSIGQNGRIASSNTKKK